MLVTGLLNTWLPLLGHGAAAALVWLHLLLLPAVMVAGMCVSWMPLVVGKRRPRNHATRSTVDVGSWDTTLWNGK